MKTVIVYESMFGNTEQFATEIRDTLRAAGVSVVLADIRTARPYDLLGSDLLVVGAPTHAFTMSRPSTRDEAVHRGADPGREVLGIREWLTLLDEGFPASAGRPLVAVFDTRVSRVRRFPGSAAHRAARVLRAQGFRIATEPRSFYVDDVTGPPSKGELAEARQWATQLPTLLVGQGSVTRGAT